MKVDYRWQRKEHIYEPNLVWYEHTGDPFATVEYVRDVWVAKVYIKPTQTHSLYYHSLEEAKEGAEEYWNIHMKDGN